MTSLEAEPPEYTEYIEKIYPEGIPSECKNIDAYRNFVVDEDGKTKLHRAAENGQVDCIRNLIYKIKDLFFLNHQDKYGMTALHYAAAKGYTEIVKELIWIDGINVNAQDNRGYTPLHYAAAKGYTEIVEDLLRMPGIDADKTSNDGYTPVSLASDKDVVALLNAHIRKLFEATKRARWVAQLETSMNPSIVNKKDKLGKTMLHYAAEKGDNDAVNKLLVVKGIDVNKQDNQYRTALSYAAEKGNIDVVQTLLAFNGIDANLGDDPTKEDPDNDWTPLHYAISKHHTNVADILRPLRPPPPAAPIAPAHQVGVSSTGMRNPFGLTLNLGGSRRKKRINNTRKKQQRRTKRKSTRKKTTKRRRR